MMTPEVPLRIDDFQYGELWDGFNVRIDHGDVLIYGLAAYARSWCLEAIGYAPYLRSREVDQEYWEHDVMFRSDANATLFAMKWL